MAESKRTQSEADMRDVVGGSAAKGERSATRSATRPALDEAKEVGTRLLGAVRESASGLLDDQRDRVANQVAAIGKALHSSAAAFDRDTGFEIGRYVEDGARQIGDFAETIRTRSWRELAADLAGFAERWPAAFFAATIGAGFVAGRLLLSPPPSPATAAAETPRSTRGAARTDAPRGGARHDYGAVSGAVSGNARAGYDRSREVG